MTGKLNLCTISAVMLAVCLLAAGSALAEVLPLPMDMASHGNAPLPEGWISEYEYQDESIHVTVHVETIPLVHSPARDAHWAEITIADPSLIRTTMSNQSYSDPSLARAASMAASVNAVLALNGDFMKYDYSTGYVVKQGVFYRDSLKGDRDILVIDDRGDFHVVPKATSQDMAALVTALRLDGGRRVVNSFSFGPILVLNGEIQDTVDIAHESHVPTQRICICQLGELSYAVVEIDGGNDTGMWMSELAEFVLSLYPDCKVAYNLDGGGSTHLMLNGQVLHNTPGDRPISDIVYFASSVSEAWK